MITRIYNDLNKYLKPNEVLIIYGPRRVGKTILLKNFLAHTSLKYRLENGGNSEIQEIFASMRADTLYRYAEGYDLIAIDEAQYIPHIGEGLKLLIETVPHIKIIATGSASFELSNKVGEPLTDRNTTLRLFPVSQLELRKQINDYELSKNNEEYLIYGSYPKVLTLQTLKEKSLLLRSLVDSYLLKDILALENIKGSKILLDLLRLLAFQVGNEVSYTELASNLPIDLKTVARYLDLLEKSFIIINIRGYSKNLRNEIKSKSKYYFYDNGIRNAIIANFNPLYLRDDIGKLWENFLVVERLKKQNYKSIIANNYFWRTWDQYEVDFVEEREGKLFGYEFKYSPTKKGSSKNFLTTYPNAEYSTINSDNYLDFVG